MSGLAAMTCQWRHLQSEGKQIFNHVLKNNKNQVVPLKEREILSVLVDSIQMCAFSKEIVQKTPRLIYFQKTSRNVFRKGVRKLNFLLD